MRVVLQTVSDAKNMFNNVPADMVDGGCWGFPSHNGRAPNRAATEGEAEVGDLSGINMSGGLFEAFRGSQGGGTSAGTNVPVGRPPVAEVQAEATANIKTEKDTWSCHAHIAGKPSYDHHSRDHRP